MRPYPAHRLARLISSRTKAGHDLRAVTVLGRGRFVVSVVWETRESQERRR